MSLFDENIIQHEYTAGDFYDIKLLNAAYHSIYKNIRRIFKVGHFDTTQQLSITRKNGLDEITNGFIVDYFKKMPIVKFEKTMDFLKKDNDRCWNRQYRVMWYLWRQMGVKWKYLRESHICLANNGAWGGDFALRIPNGAVIESATADGITIVFKRK